MTIHDDHPRKRFAVVKAEDSRCAEQGPVSRLRTNRARKGRGIRLPFGECTTPSARRAEEESVIALLLHAAL